MAPRFCGFCGSRFGKNHMLTVSAQAHVSPMLKLTHGSLNRYGGDWFLDDYDVLEDDRVIARILRDGENSEIAPWFWIIVGRMPSIESGRTATLEGAMAEVTAQWQRPAPPLPWDDVKLPEKPTTAFGLTPEERLAEAERHRRDRQEAEAGRSMAKPVSREEYLKWYDEGHSERIEVAKAIGVPNEYAEKIVAEQRGHLVAVPVGSGFDAPDIMSILLPLSNDVKAALRLPELLRNGVLISPTSSLTPGYGRLVSVYPDTSIVEIGEFTLRFCNQVAKAMALTVPDGVYPAVRKFEKYRKDGTPPTDEEVLKRWATVFQAYATQDAPSFLDKNQPPFLGARWAIMDAMELFAVAHEYGHHVNDGLAPSDDSISEERRADLFARVVCYDVGHRVRNTPYNFYLTSGAGAALLLGSLEILLKTRQMLKYGNDLLKVSETHPAVMDRVRVFDTLEKGLLDLSYKPERFSKFRYAILFILETIWLALKPGFEALHKNGVRPTPDPSDVLGRLFTQRP
jgi:hypothetical protein